MRFLLPCLLLTISLGAAASAQAQTSTTTTTRTTVRTSKGPAKPAVAAKKAGKPGTKFVRGNNGQQTIACNDDDVVVSGNNNNISIKGTCTRLLISGSHNTVQANKLWVLRTSGADNIVRWTGAAPKITDTGDGNILSAE